MIQVNEVFLELFRAHGIEAVLRDDWIAFPQSTIRARATLAREVKQQSGLTVQLDIDFEVAPGTTLVESFAGVGETTDKAVADAIHNFVLNSFHVLLTTFLKPDDEQVSREEWFIGETKRRVTVGNAGIRGEFPVQGNPALGWFTYLQEKLSSQHLGPEVHWVRLYYGQVQNKALTCEVLLDNEVWDDVQAEMSAFDWPSSTGFYSVRLFLTIAAQTPDPLTPEGAVSLLAQIAASNPNLTEDEIYQALEKTGVSHALAGRAVNFTQIAWGRILLARMGITFAASYFYFDSQGNTIETGEVARERFFVAASRLCTRYMGSPAFQRLSLASADVQAVNSAVSSGTAPENLRSCTMSPPFSFVEPPTPDGWKRAEEVIKAGTNPRKAST